MSTAETMIRSGITKGAQLLADFNRRRMARSEAPHPYLSGIHAPMGEEHTIGELAVTGVIPKALDGRYLRIGPNPIKPEAAGHHWFIGDGMIHGVALRDGRALWYRNRWIRSTHVSRALGQPPASGPRREHAGDNVNTNVVSMAGKTWALVEAGPYPLEISESLDGQTFDAFGGTLEGSFTAHPHRDPLTGEHHAIAYDAHQQDRIRHVVLSPEGRVTRELAISVDHGPSVHDCAITARYAIIMDLPVTFSMKAHVGGHRFPYQWNPKHQARIGLLPRAGSADDILWCTVEPCYVFHVANAYDAADGSVILDVVAYDKMFADSKQGPDAVGRFERWTIEPSSRTVMRRIVDASPQEFPRQDERRFGQNYRYAYTLAVGSPSAGAITFETRLYKHDLHAFTKEVHEFGKNRYPGEFVFVPASPDAAEDEGWLVGLVINTDQETTDLAIIDAQAFSREPVATIRIPHRIPPGFHGNFVGRHS